MLVYKWRLEVFKTKERWHKLPFVIFKSKGGGGGGGGEEMKHSQKIDGVVQMVVILTHKTMSCLVVGMFDDLVGLLSY